MTKGVGRYLAQVGDTLAFVCPGCTQANGGRRVAHHVKAFGSPALRPHWLFNGDPELPTLTPSVRVSATDPAGHGGAPATRCHLFVTLGQITYLGDSRHPLAGRTVDMVPWAGEAP